MFFIFKLCALYVNVGNHISLFPFLWKEIIQLVSHGLYKSSLFCFPFVKVRWFILLSNLKI